MLKTFLPKCACLRSSMSLRKQLLTSFGFTALVTITLVVIMGIISVIYAGYTVRQKSRDLMLEQLLHGVSQSSRFLAETTSEKLDNLHGISKIMGELVKDRIVGYPDSGYEFDLHVPFLDHDTQRNIYPIISPPLPVDWNITLNIGDENEDEHTQVSCGRSPMLSINKASTASASLFFQGVCNPDEIDPTSDSYYPNCTESHNDIGIGGVVQPTESSYWLAQKAAELGALLKPLYESQVDLGMLGIYMHNMGAGMTVHFPGYIRDPHHNTTYISIGCDWMREINNYTGQPLGTEDDIARCHPAGQLVSNRDYNPMERPFCRDQALNPGQNRMFGPYRATTYGKWIVSFGQAVFDRLTGHFIACTSVDVPIEGLEQDLKRLLFADYQEVVFTRWDGTFVAGSSYNQSNAGDTVQVAETGFINQETFDELLHQIDFQQFVRQNSGKGSDNREDFWLDYVNHLRSTTINVNPNVVSAYPLPLPPFSYDPNYKPEFVVIISVSEAKFESIDEMGEHINRDVLHFSLIFLAIGVTGLVVVLLIVWTVSALLTKPLNWMESIANSIVNPADEVIQDDDDCSPLIRFTPKTEITELVVEFRKMIGGFSGEGSSSVATSVSDVSNILKWQDCFKQLYDFDNDDEKKSNTTAGRRFHFLPSASQKNLSTIIEESPSCRESTEVSEVVEEGVGQVSPTSTTNVTKKMNPDRIVYSQDHASSGQFEQVLDEQQIGIHQISLFFWIMVLIAIPLLLTNVIICYIAMYDIMQVLPSWVSLTRESSSELVLRALNATVSLRASFAEEILNEPIRDLFLLTRLGGFLYFNGITRSNSFTQMVSSAEECKTYPFGSCPYYSNNSRTPCDCSWNDVLDHECQSYEFDTRKLQRMDFSGQAQDADELNGDRENVSYPEHDTSPPTTSWWKNMSDMPGSWKGPDSSGYETAYDRLRVGSAATIYVFPIYNYLNEGQGRKHFLGSYIAFDADGMLTGFSGCEYISGQMPFFQSTADNNADELGEGLCPLGKYGFDARCRDWYVTGKDNTEFFGDSLYIAPPYLMVGSSGNLIALTATSSLVDPVSGEHVAQTVLDFIPQGMFEALYDTDAFFPLVIAPKADSTGSDTLIGPNHTIESAPTSAEDLILNFDLPSSVNRDAFRNEVMEKMKKGESAAVRYNRSNEDGSQQSLVMSFAPIAVRSTSPLHPNDYARGCECKRKFVYSLGLSVRETDLLEPFYGIAEDIRRNADMLAVVYLVIVIIISIAGALFTCLISVAVTKPMIILLRVVQKINSGRIEDNIPPMVGGSKEVNHVYISFAKLYRILRYSNVAFFSGNLKRAHNHASDALQLFKKIHNQKAIAVASNNLGNTLSAMSMRKPFSSSGFNTCNKVDGVCCARAAIDHYNRAIRQSYGDFADIDNLKIDYAQQLADRLFNRALLYLIPRECGCLPVNAKELGYQDLARAKALDDDVREVWLQNQMMLEKSDVYFERNLRRLCGLVCLDGDIRCREIWSFNSLLNETIQVLSVARDEPTAPLFRKVSKTGRVQQIEATAAMLELSRGNEFSAARLGMRMLVEDGFLIDYALRTAGDAVLRFIKSEAASAWTDDSISSVRADLRQMTRNNANGGWLNVGKCFVMCLDISEKSASDKIISKICTNCLLLLDQYVSKEDYVCLVSSNSELQHSELNRKEVCEEKQRADIQKISSFKANGNEGNQVLPIATQMVADSNASIEYDTFILYITDGSSCDIKSLAKARNQIARMNAKRETVVHAIIIGLDLYDDENFINQCISLSTVSRPSVYIETSGEESLDAAFETVTDVITGNGAPRELIRGITMEKF